MSTTPAKPDSDSQTLLALLTPRRLVKTVKTALEAQGIWGRRIETIVRQTEVGGSGLGVGEEMYLVYSTLFRDDVEDSAECDTESEEGWGAGELETCAGAGAMEASDRLKAGGGEIAALVRDGHVTMTYVSGGDAAASCATASTSAGIGAVRAATQTFLEDNPPPPTSISTETDSFSSIGATKQLLLSTLPKRWSLYTPLVLLPPTAFSSPQWKEYLAALGPGVRQKFYRCFTTSIYPDATHLALNAPIPPTTTTGTTAPTATENIMRSPSNLTPLLGSFGPPPPCDPCESTLSETLFVTTTQLGITQTWAPLHTMFSRGNISEKSRIVAPHFPGISSIPGSAIVDLYAGIGYFTFCYLKAAARVALCWELNPWSVEGFVRGMSANGFGQVLVVCEGEPTPPLDGVRAVVFNEDNRHAGRRLRELREMRNEPSQVGLGIKHVNLGLLPTSEGGWENAVNALTDGDGEMGWAHVHENVAVAELAQKATDVETRFRELVSKVGRGEWQAKLDGGTVGVKVKMYAPGVVHMVYDISVWREK